MDTAKEFFGQFEVQGKLVKVTDVEKTKREMRSMGWKYTHNSPCMGGVIVYFKRRKETPGVPHSSIV